MKSLKMIMESSIYGRWIIPFKKFSMVRVNIPMYMKELFGLLYHYIIHAHVFNHLCSCSNHRYLAQEHVYRLTCKPVGLNYSIKCVFVVTNLDLLFQTGLQNMKEKKKLFDIPFQCCQGSSLWKRNWAYFIMKMLYE